MRAPPLPMIGIPCKKCLVQVMCTKTCHLYRKRVNLNVKIVDSIIHSALFLAVATLFWVGFSR